MSGWDVCVIGSGAGGGPVAAMLAEAGYQVAVVERGPRFDESQFLRDEIAHVRRSPLKQSDKEAPAVLETIDARGQAVQNEGGYFNNGHLVGGSGVLMSGFFLRLKPFDFRQRSLWGPVQDANVVDWPISYEDLEPYYTRVEHEIGVSGRVAKEVVGRGGTMRPVDPAHLEPRSNPDAYPQPPLAEHPFATRLDRTCGQMDLHSLPLPRAVLSRPTGGPGDRKACDYNGYCGSYGCHTGAKGTSLSEWIPRAEATGRCTVFSRLRASRFLYDDTGTRVVSVEVVTAEGERRRIDAGHFVVSCQAIESARLLLNSRGSGVHAQGLGNRYGQVGRNFLSAVSSGAWGSFPAAGNPDYESRQPFINRYVPDFNVLDPARTGGLRRGGMLNFLLFHPNPIYRAIFTARDDHVRVANVGLQGGGRGRRAIPRWGGELKQRLAWFFRDTVHLKCENFGEFYPHDDCFIRVDPRRVDPHGVPLAVVRERIHPASVRGGLILMEQARRIIAAAGSRDARTGGGVAASRNLLAGGCRFGTDPRSSVLDPECRVHEARNVFVSDGSFMPTGGSVPFTFTIYANALRVADAMIRQLGGWRDPNRTPPSTLSGRAAPGSPPGGDDIALPRPPAGVAPAGPGGEVLPGGSQNPGSGG